MNKTRTIPGLTYLFTWGYTLDFYDAGRWIVAFDRITGDQEMGYWK